MDVMAPGCYGIPSILNLSSTTCLGCRFFSSCRLTVVEELNSVAYSPVIGKALAEHDRFEERFIPNDVQQKILASVPAGVRKNLTVLFERGMDRAIGDAVLHEDVDLIGPDIHRSLRLALELLIFGGFTKKELQLGFVNTLGWSARSAWSQASLTWKLLIALQVAIESSGRLVVTPRLLNENRQSDGLIKGNYGNH
jgi:hypothetical protein